MPNTMPNYVDVLDKVLSVNGGLKPVATYMSTKLISSIYALALISINYIYLL